MSELAAGRPLWPEINPKPAPYPVLDRDIECEVAVIGGGITGALIAHHLVREGIDTVLLDAGRVAMASTSVSTSILQYEVDYDITGLSGMIGHGNAVQAFRLCESALRGISDMVQTLDDDCGYAPRDCLYYTVNAGNAGKMHEEYEARRKEGFDVEFLDSAKAKELFSFPVAAGILSRNLGAEIDPFRLTHALMRRGTAKGMRVFESTDCDSMAQDDVGMLVTTKEGCLVRAERIVVATGYDIRKQFDDVEVSMGTSFALATAPVDTFAGWSGRCIIRDDGDPYKYLRTTSDNRIIIGGRDSTILNAEGQVAGFIPVTPLLDMRYKALEGELRAMFPGIPGIRAEYRYAGLFGDTKDGLPYIGEYPGRPNIYHGMCFGSNGILYAVLAGGIIRDLYLGRKPEGVDLFRFGR